MDIFKTNCCFDYKVTGIGVGVVGIVLTIGFAAFFGPIFLIFGDVIIVLVAVSMLVLNLACSIIWLCGVGRKKPSLLLVSLFWWAAPLSLWIGFIFFVLFKGVADYFEDKKPHLRDYDLIYPVTVFFIAFYFAAVMSYNSMKEAIKRSRSEIPRLDVSYMVTATDCKEFDVCIGE